MLRSMDQDELSRQFKENPGAVLRANGLNMSPKDVARIKSELDGLSRPVAGAEANPEVSVVF